MASTPPFLVYPDPPPPVLAQTLDLAGHRWVAVASPGAAERNEPEDGWAGAVVAADDDAEGAWALCRSLRKRDAPLEPLLVLVSGAQLGELELREDLYDDFCLSPFHPRELEAWEALCRELGEEPADVAIAWLLANPVVTAPIIGPRTMEQFTGSLRALEIELAPDVLDRLDKIFPGPGGPAPEAYAW